MAKWMLTLLAGTQGCQALATELLAYLGRTGALGDIKGKDYLPNNIKYISLLTTSKAALRPTV